jgi:flavin-dependent dehydrogenase
MPELFDVIIVGGGPAGSTAGTLLAQHGRKVVILEKEIFPRFKIGESLLPASLPVLERMGVKRKIDEADVIVKYGGKITSACGTRSHRFLFNNTFNCQHPNSYQVERATFDKILLDHAEEQNCKVIQGAAVISLEFHPNQVVVKTADTDFHGKYLLDCSGRNNLVGNHLKLRKDYPHLRKFALYAHWENFNHDSEIDRALTQMVRTPNQWIWMIAVTQKKTSIGVVLDAKLFKEMRLSPEIAYDKILKENPQVMRHLTNARRITDVYATGEYSFRNKQFAGDHWVLAGDAMGFIDPVWSSGVFFAILSGEKSADMIHRILEKPEVKTTEYSQYEKHLRQIMDLYLKWVTSWYQHEFAEVFLNPREFCDLVPAINTVLAGSEHQSFSIRWRLWLFHLLVYLQKKYAFVAPRMSLLPNPAISSNPFKRGGTSAG